MSLSVGLNAVEKGIIYFRLMDMQLVAIPAELSGLRGFFANLNNVQEETDLTCPVWCF
jgi:hypothetical protein